MNKEWYKSKTVWTAIIVGLMGVAEAAGISIPENAYTLLAALGLYSVRDAIN